MNARIKYITECGSKDRSLCTPHSSNPLLSTDYPDLEITDNNVNYIRINLIIIFKNVVDSLQLSKDPLILNEMTTAEQSDCKDALTSETNL